MIGQAKLAAQLDKDKAWDEGPNLPLATKRIGGFLCLSDRSELTPGTPAPTSYVGMAGVGPDAALLTVADPHAGIFGYDRRVTRDDLGSGRSQTILALETTQNNGPWMAGGPATVRPLLSSEEPQLGHGRPFGGLHANGLNILYADGEVEFVRNTIRADLLERQVRIHREE